MVHRGRGAMAQTLHLAIDWQNHYLAAAGSESDTLAARCAAAVRQFSAQGISTVWVTTGTVPLWQRLTPQQESLLPRRYDVPAALAPVMRGYHAVKTSDSAFGNPALLPYLRQRGCTNLLISGFMLRHCVAATVQDALGHGFICTLLPELIRDHADAADTALRTRRLREHYGFQSQIRFAHPPLPQWPYSGLLRKTPAAQPLAYQRFRALHDSIVY